MKNQKLFFLHKLHSQLYFLSIRRKMLAVLGKENKESVARKRKLLQKHQKMNWIYLCCKDSS